MLACQINRSTTSLEVILLHQQQQSRDNIQCIFSSVNGLQLGNHGPILMMIDLITISRLLLSSPSQFLGHPLTSHRGLLTLNMVSAVKGTSSMHQKNPFTKILLCCCTDAWRWIDDRWNNPNRYVRTCWLVFREITRDYIKVSVLYEHMLILVSFCCYSIQLFS